MADCPCTHTPSTQAIPTTTDAVVYDGGATCTGFTAGDMNDFITHVTDLICAIQASLVALGLDADDIGTGGITGTTCVPTAGTTDLGDWLSDLEAYLCALQTQVNSLEVGDIGGTFDITCFGGGAAESLEDTIAALILEVCSINSGQLTLDLIRSGGDGELPLLPFAKDDVTITDISALGVAKVNIDATDYWINAKALSMISTNINLIDSQDNYIFIDATTDAYTVSPVAIGGATPTTDGDKIAMVRTGVGTVTSITTIVSRSPIDSSILLDDSITADKLDSAIGLDPIENDGTNIKLNYNTTNFDVSGGDLILKNGGVNTAAKIASAVFENSIGLSAGSKWEVKTEDSIELDGATGKVQLKNDAASPGNSFVYGTDSSGNKGYHQFGEYSHTRIDITPTVGVGIDTYTVSDDVSGVIDYHITSYPLSTDNEIRIHLGTIEPAYAGAVGKRIRVFLDTMHEDAFADSTRVYVTWTSTPAGIPIGYTRNVISALYDGVSVKNYIDTATGLAVPSAAGLNFIEFFLCTEFVPNYNLTSVTDDIAIIGFDKQLYTWDGATLTAANQLYLF